VEEGEEHIENRFYL
jgi:hypothetical protein